MWATTEETRQPRGYLVSNLWTSPRASPSRPATFEMTRTLNMTQTSRKDGMVYKVIEAF